MPVMLSTRNAWFSAPRLNFSSRGLRNSGVAPAEIADVERETDAERRPVSKRRIQKHHAEENEGEEQVDDQRERRTGQEIPDVLQFANPRDGIADPAGLEVGDG